LGIDCALYCGLTPKIPPHWNVEAEPLSDDFDLILSVPVIDLGGGATGLPLIAQKGNKI